MMPASNSTPAVVRDDDGILIELIGLAVERFEAFAGMGTAHAQIALDLPASKTCSGRARSNSGNW